MYLRLQWPRWLRTCKDKEAEAVEISSLSNAEPCISVDLSCWWLKCLSVPVDPFTSHSILLKRNESCFTAVIASKMEVTNMVGKWWRAAGGLQGSFIWSLTENKTVAQEQLGSPLWCRTLKEGHKHLQRHTWSSLFQPCTGKEKMKSLQYKMCPFFDAGF